MGSCLPCHLGKAASIPIKTTLYYFVMGIPWQILRYNFQTRTTGKLNKRYTVESRPAAPPIIAIIITPRLILIPTFPNIFTCNIHACTTDSILKPFRKGRNRFTEPLT